MIALLAQLKEKPLGGQLEGIGPLGLEGRQPNSGITTLVDVISKIVGILTVAAVIWFSIQFILGAFRWMTSQGDAKAVEDARMQIIHAIIGLILIFGTMIIIAVLGRIAGIDFINLEFLIRSLRPGGTSGGGAGGVGGGQNIAQ